MKYIRGEFAYILLSGALQMCYKNENGEKFFRRFVIFLRFFSFADRIFEENECDCDRGKDKIEP